MFRRSRRTDDDFAQEIQSHLDLETERLIAEGMSPHDACLAARRRFGNVTRAAEQFYEARRVRWFDHLRHDLRCAFRSIARSPIACAVAITSLAAGIGATTSTLTVRNAIFYNPPPLYRDPGQLSRIETSTPDQRRAAVPGALYALWSADADLRAHMTVASAGRAAELRKSDGTETVRVRSVSPDFFGLLGVVPAQGRSCSTDGAAEAVLSHQVWQNLFEGRPEVLGREVWLDRQPYTVVGVLPERFWFQNTNSPIWTCSRPEALAQSPALDVVVRRDRGITHAALAERLQRDASDYISRQADGPREIRVRAMHIGGTGLGDQIAIVIPWLVGMAVLLTLLIACANVAILMFARWTGREREMAIRTSLGASRWRAVSLLLTESVVLAFVGGLLGVCATFALRGVFQRNVPGAGDFDLTIDRVILLQSALVTFLTGILSGIIPALYETRRLQANPLRLLASSDRARQRWRHALVVLEISVTVALMVVAAGQVDASRRMLTADVGFATTPLLTARVENPAGVSIPIVLDAVGRVPGVAAAAASSAVPMATSAPWEQVSGGADGVAAVTVQRASITPEYFATLAVAVLAGRTFGPQDQGPSSHVAIVNDILARQLWPGRDAIAARIWVNNAPYEIVGVVAGYATYPLRPPSPRFYLPLRIQPPNPTHVQIVIRAAHDPSSLVRPVRQELRQLGATYSVPSAFTLNQVIEVGAGEIMTLTYAISPLLGIGLFLTATGIFGVLAFAIARRSKELALRVALGATSRELGRLVVVHTFWLLATGVIAGVAGTFALTRMVRAAGGAGSPFDTPGWEAFVVPVLVVLAVGAFATWIPARRAIRIDPAILLKTE